MGKHLERGEMPHTPSSDMEIEKGKDKLQAYDIHLGKGGEGTSGTNKEGSAKGDHRRSGKCVPK